MISSSMNAVVNPTTTFFSMERALPFFKRRSPQDAVKAREDAVVSHPTDPPILARRARAGKRAFTAASERED